FSLVICLPPRSTLFPYTTLFRSKDSSRKRVYDEDSLEMKIASFFYECILKNNANHKQPNLQSWANEIRLMLEIDKRNKDEIGNLDRKSTRLNSSHVKISYAVFCL